MKRLLTIRPWKIFLLTAGLPILSVPIGFILIVFEVFSNSFESIASPDFLRKITASAWLMGLIIMHIWAGSVSIKLQQYTSSPRWLTWSKLLAIIVASAMLLFFAGITAYAALEPALKVEEPAQGGFDSFPNQRMTLVWLALCALWFLPRLTIYGINSWLLVKAEGRKRWFTTFILFILWPIGIWFLQARIQKIITTPKERNIAEHLI